MRLLLNAVLAASLVLAPTVSAAAAAPAPPPVDAQARAGAELEDASELRGSWWIIGLAILAAIILLLVLLDDDDEDVPVSP